MRRICATAQEAPALRHGAVRVATSSAIRTPVAAGLRRPAVLIPTDFLTAFTPAELEHVVLHEAAHLARRDHLVLLMQRAIEAIFWMHPAVRLIARRIDLEREIACDDLVVAGSRNPREYASCLTRMAELCGGIRPSPAAAGFAEYRPHLSQRVELIMKQTRASFRHRRVVLAVLVSALCALGMFLVRRPAMVAFAAPQIASTPGPVPRPASEMAAAAELAPTPSPAPRPQRTPSPAPSPAAHLVALHFDLTSMTANDLARAIGTALTFIDTRMQEGQAVAVMVWNGQMQVRQDFTANRDALRQAIRGVAAQPVSGASDTASRIIELRKVIGTLSNVDGKKALVYLSAGPVFPPDGDRQTLDDLKDTAVRANLAIYLVDARTAH
jgi:hypothetical protein